MGAMTKINTGETLTMKINIISQKDTFLVINFKKVTIDVIIYLSNRLYHFFFKSKSRMIYGEVHVYTRCYDII